MKDNREKERKRHRGKRGLKGRGDERREKR